MDVANGLVLLLMTFAGLATVLGVLSASASYIAAPAAAQTLADLGADVVKLEPTQGDASRHVGWSKDDVDLYEINEAYAAVVLAVGARLSGQASFSAPA